MAFYDFDDEQIFLDVDLNSIHWQTCVDASASSQQDLHIFSGSIYDNIVLGNPKVTLERRGRDHRQRPRLHQPTPEVSHPPNRTGSKLVPRLRQLLALPVLAADPEILVLDEATANIDTETELLIQRRLSG